MEITASSLAWDGRQPGIIIKMPHINHERIALPVADGVAEVRGIHVGAMTPAVGRHEAITAWLISITGVYLIQNHGKLRRLHDLPRRTGTRNPKRFAVECWIILNRVCCKLLY